MLLELLGFPLQCSLGSTRFSRPLCCILMEKDYRAQQFIDMLFRPYRVLLDLLPIMGSLATWTLFAKHEICLPAWRYFCYCTLCTLVLTRGGCRHVRVPGFVDYPLSQYVEDITIGERSGLLRVRAGKGNKARSVPLNSSAREAIATYAAPRLGMERRSVKE